MKSKFLVAIFAILTFISCNSKDNDVTNESKTKPTNLKCLVSDDLVPALGMDITAVRQFIENLGFSESKQEHPWHSEYDYEFTKNGGKETVGIFLNSNTICQISYEARLGISPSDAADWMEYHGKYVMLDSKRLPLVIAEYSDYETENETDDYDAVIKNLRQHPLPTAKTNVSADFLYSQTEAIGMSDFVSISYTQEGLTYNYIDIIITKGSGESGQKQDVIHL